LALSASTLSLLTLAHVLGADELPAQSAVEENPTDGKQKAEKPGNGLTGAKPFFPPGEEVSDAVKVRYKFRVVANESPHIKIIFGWNRLRGTNEKSYLIETNLYADGLRYDGDVQTTWPMKGRWTAKEASLRMAIPDYNGQGKTGAKTFSPKQFPRQAYLIDGIKDLPKTDLISQLNLNGQEVSVELARGELIKEKQGWKLAGALDDDEYRQWNARVTIGGDDYTMAFAVPDASGRYLAREEMLFFSTEFLQTKGLFQVHFWDAALQREASDAWQPLNQWLVTHNDGDPRTFGIRLARHGKANVLEFSNDDRAGYLERDSTIDLAAGKFVRGSSPQRRAENWRTMTLALEKLSEKWDQPWVDAANRIAQKTDLTDQDWITFFDGYFTSHKATANLWAYLWYPAFGWFDKDTHRKLQLGLNVVAKKRVQQVLTKHPQDLEEFLAKHPDDRADLAAWLAFLQAYEKTRDASLADQGNARWVAKLIAENPKWLSSSGVANSVKHPQAAWLKTNVEAIVK
jgi:hypothetical protein